MKKILIIIYNSEKKIKIKLPTKITSTLKLIKGYDFLRVEKISSHYRLKENKSFEIKNLSQQTSDDYLILPNHIYQIKIIGTKEEITLVVKDNKMNFGKQQKIKLLPNTPVTYSDKLDLGVDYQINSSITLNIKFILKWQDGKYSIILIQHSTNIYLNNRVLKSKHWEKLSLGDVISWIGGQLLIGLDFICLCNCQELAIINQSVFEEWQKLHAKNTVKKGVAKTIFSRSPRFKRDIEVLNIVIDAPPPIQIAYPQPIILSLGPAFTMGITSAVTGVYSVYQMMVTDNFSAAIPTLIMTSSMLIGSLLWPILSRKYESYQNKKQEQIRVEKYQSYLTEIQFKIKQELHQQKKILLENHPSAEECWARVVGMKREMWERSFEHNDFLKFRLGSGSYPLMVNISLPKQQFSLNTDHLLEKALEIGKKSYFIDCAPISISLSKEHCIGAYGKHYARIEFIKNIIIQSLSLYGYDNLKIILIGDDKKLAFFYKTLHFFDTDYNFRFWAKNQSDMKEITYYFKQMHDASLFNRQLANGKSGIPHYLFLVINRQIANYTELFSYLLNNQAQMNTSIIHCYETLDELPKECSKVIQLKEKSGRIFNNNDISQASLCFEYDIFNHTNLENFSKKMANTYLLNYSSQANFPDKISFLEMFSIINVNDFDLITRWQTNNPVDSLEAEIGINRYGQKIMLDIHEKAHGPHGLIAGMTGSGKSELIINYILSMAVNYHPDEVAFVLIDYKGGGMAKVFENLPHVVGLITNLDGNLIYRALVSLESELKVRQKLFIETSEMLNISNIDIYTYQKLYRQALVDKPLPHLIIVADEFAELKSQVPDFMEQLISIARIGRSLGIHLILATQKPTGVVSDQIWSNSRFKIALKVQDKADSQEIIKCSKASEIAKCGQFYFQVGNNEIFEFGLSAFAGTAYMPNVDIKENLAYEVAIINSCAQKVKTIQKNIASNEEASIKQLDAVIKHIYNSINYTTIKRSELWRPPLQNKLFFINLKKRYSKKCFKEKRIIIGEIDFPEIQQQELLSFQIADFGNWVIYGAVKSGKTMLLTTIIYGLISQFNAKKINIYLLDFSIEFLKCFEFAPQISEVLFADDKEKIINMFKILKQEMTIRRNILNSSKIISEMTKIVVVIANFANFKMQFEGLNDELTLLLREGEKFGIHFILTASSQMDIGYQLLRYIKQFIVLELNDSSEYSNIFDEKVSFTPSKIAGRGLIKLSQVYEFQTVCVTQSENPYAEIVKYCKKINYQAKGNIAPKIKTLPSKVSVNMLKNEQTQINKIPIGIDSLTLNNFLLSVENKYIIPLLSLKKQSNHFAIKLIELLSSSSNYNIWSIFSEKDLINLIKSEFFEKKFRNNIYEEVKDTENVNKIENIIFIFDLKSIIQNIQNSLKEKLFHLFSSKNTFKNITFFWIEHPDNLYNFQFEEWYQMHLEKGDGIWIGSGFFEQYFLEATNLHHSFEDIANDTGYVIEQNNAVQVKFLS